MSARWTIFGSAPGVLPFLAILGCAVATAPQIEMASYGPSEKQAEGEWLQRDPRGYLEDCLERCKEHPQYSLTLYRQERLGLIPALQQPEYIHVLYRARPLSIKMAWLDPGSESAQALYVEGQDERRMQLLPRRGPFGLPPAVMALDLDAPILWGKAKRRITEFGLARMLERTLEALDRRDQGNPPTIRYLGLKDLEQLDQPAHQLRIDYPPESGAKHAVQDLFIGADTKLPAGTFLWLAGEQLDAAYLYSELDLTPNLKDEDFAINPGAARTR
jgi:hypothetical protein